MGTLSSIKWTSIAVVVCLAFYLGWDLLFPRPGSFSPGDLPGVRGKEAVKAPSPSRKTSSFPGRRPEPLRAAPNPSPGEKNPGNPVGSGEGGKVPLSGERMDPILEGALGRITAEGLSFEERRAAWEDLAKRGLLKDVVRALGRMAEENPDDFRVLLLFGEGARKLSALSAGGPGREDWADKAERAYEKVLGRDPENWEARFGRAALLAGSRALEGRRRDGESRLEELIRWQEDQPPKPAFSRTYLLLGDSYRDDGDQEAARRIWQKGLERFPENEDLRRRLER